MRCAHAKKISWKAVIFGCIYANWFGVIFQSSLFLSHAHTFAPSQLASTNMASNRKNSEFRMKSI